MRESNYDAYFEVEFKMTHQDFNFEYSPASYFENLTLEEKLGVKIKGRCVYDM